MHVLYSAIIIQFHSDYIYYTYQSIIVIVTIFTIAYEYRVCEIKDITQHMHIIVGCVGVITSVRVVSTGIHGHMHTEPE